MIYLLVPLFYGVFSGMVFKFWYVRNKKSMDRKNIYNKYL